MRLKKPKSVYIQVRTNPKDSRNFTVYDTTLEQVCSRIKEALGESTKREGSKREAAPSAG